MSFPEFCRECGAHFPPRDGEGRCKEWEVCATKIYAYVGNYPVKSMSKLLDQKTFVDLIDQSE